MRGPDGTCWRRGKARAGAVGRGTIVALAAVLLLVVALWLVARGRRREAIVTTRGSGAAAPTGAGAESAVALGTAAQEQAFDGCPIDGDGGDRALNRLKNRTAVGQWRDVPLDSVLRLPWPRAGEDRNRSRWPAGARRAVAPDESRAVRVQGYLVLARQSGPESTNCHGKAARYRDYHLWLTTDPSVDRQSSVIAEMTPRVRAMHARWTLKVLNGVARRHDPVRVSGWLLLDQEHPEQLGRTRGTLWEVHPVMQFEVRRGSRWVPLDDLRE